MKRLAVASAILAVAWLAIASPSGANTIHRAAHSSPRGASVSRLPALPHMSTVHSHIRLRPMEPTGCPSPNPDGYTCDYYVANGGPGDICFYRSGNVSNWGALTGPGGQNCHTEAKALVNTHNNGDVALYSATDYSGEETCIGAASYYDNLAYNYYPNGHSLEGNINSSYWYQTGTC